MREGLSQKEAEILIKKFGPNGIDDRSNRAVKIFFRQLQNFLIIVLAFAALVSFLVGEAINGVVVFFIILFIIALGFFQEYKADKALQSLKKMLSFTARAVRDGKTVSIPAHQIVPGDLIVIEAGDKIPADAKILESYNFETNESALTGESMPIKKRAGKMIFGGTSCVSGYAKASVAKTGMGTEFGKIASSLREIEEKIPLVEQIRAMSKQIAAIVFIIALSVFFIGLSKGENVSGLLVLSAAIAVAGVPEALPAVMTVMLSLSAGRMAERKAIVKSLPAVETLGSTSVICTDKTGTITFGEMSVTDIFTDRRINVTGSLVEGEFLSGKHKINAQNDSRLSLLLQAFYVCNNSSVERVLGGWKINGDRTEGALLAAAIKGGIKPDVKKLQEKPFDQTTKTMSVLADIGRKTVFLKGAPEAVIAGSKYLFKNGERKIFTDKERKKAMEINDRFAKDGLRVIAAAYKTSDILEENNMIFLGLAAMKDPVRPEAKEYINLCKQAGIKVIMITGDNPLTAKAIAESVGLKGKVLCGHDLEKMDDSELEKNIDKVSVFARTTPSHKMRIIEALQKKGHVVAMTGDGVNDAPALKKADIGVAMGSGTDVAKDAADVVLVDDNFSTIVSAVEEGRVIYGNIRKFTSYLLSSNFAEISLILAAFVLGLPLPLLALQILWINLVTDEIPALGLSAEPNAENVMRKKPRGKKEKILSGFVLKHTVFISAVILLAAFFVFWIYIGNIEKARTATFATLIALELFNAFNSRSLEKSIFKIKIHNKKLVLAVIGSIIAMLAAIYVPFMQEIFGTVPLAALDWVVIFAAGSSVLIAAEIKKAFSLRVGKQ